MSSLHLHTDVVCHLYTVVVVLFSHPRSRVLDLLLTVFYLILLLAAAFQIFI